MKAPLVSIVVAAHNSANYLPLMLHSILEQRYRPLELILVDDGSTDDFDGAILPYKDDLADIVVIRFGRNMGLPAALNAGFKAARGDFIARMDADDFMYEWRLRDQVLFLLEHPDCELVGGGADVFGTATDMWRSPISYSGILSTFLVGNPFLHPTVMIRRRLFDAGLFIYNEYLPTEEDYELWSRLIPSSNCANLDQSVIRYRLHSNNNQRHPAKLEIKKLALQQFLTHFGICEPQLVSALAEYQCGGFVRAEHFPVLKHYAHEAEAKELPKLGFLQNALTTSNSYREFFERTSKKGLQFGLR